METRYRTTERGRRISADEKLARAEEAIERSYIDVRSHAEAAEAAEEALALVAEARRLLAAESDDPWEGASLATRRSRSDLDRSELR